MPLEPFNQPYFLNFKARPSDDVYINSFYLQTPTKRRAVIKLMKYLATGGITESRNGGIIPM